MELNRIILVGSIVLVLVGAPRTYAQSALAPALEPSALLAAPPANAGVLVPSTVTSPSGNDTGVSARFC